MLLFEFDKILPDEEEAISHALHNEMWSDRDAQLAKRLRTFGWLQVGGGSFSSVFINPKKKFVLKVNFRPDLGYAKYVDAIHRSRNPHFPVISDKKTLSINNKVYSAYLIERLEPLQNFQVGGEYITYIMSYVAKYPHQSIRRDARAISRFSENQIFNFLDENPKLVKALKYIGKLPTGYKIDLHTDNFMQRPDGTIVISDPYGYKETTADSGPF